MWHPQGPELRLCDAEPCPEQVGVAAAGMLDWEEGGPAGSDPDLPSHAGKRK